MFLNAVFSLACMVCFLAALPTSAQKGTVVNSIDKPIEPGTFHVHTRVYAQIPDPPEGGTSRIVCIITRLGSLFICTFRRIWRIDRKGRIKLFMNVEQAISEATDRQLGLTNRVHGGVRSIAFHPKYWRNRLFYLSAMETRPSSPEDFRYLSDVANPIGSDGVLLEFRTAGKGYVPIYSSYRCVFRVGMPVYDHTIKQIAFAGHYLFVAHGDGSVQDATFGGGMNSDARGKILRINPLQDGDKPYSIPRNNPFKNNPLMIDEVYALGFRNPHHICLDKYRKGQRRTLYVAETGRSNVEEVLLLKTGGGNYGWPAREGTFQHRRQGLVKGIRPLPADDAKYGYIYPNAQVGHVGLWGTGFHGQAIAGGCPVENDSPMAGNYFYADFPISGRLFYSTIADLKAAVVKGPPETLTQATTFQAPICFDHDNDPSTPPLPFETLGDVMRSEPGMANKPRVDLRIGRGAKGELYWSSKHTGRIYLMMSSLNGGTAEPC